MSEDRFGRFFRDIQTRPSPIDDQGLPRNDSHRNELKTSHSLLQQLNKLPIDPREVFVVHGRNSIARTAVFDFLRAIELRPLGWDEVVIRTHTGSPFVLEVLERGFEIAQAVVVILTPDEEVTLCPALCQAPDDAKPRYQPRPNVLFEAGMAFMRDRERTILLHFGSTDVLSDLSGVHMLSATRDPLENMKLRVQFAERLEKAGCPVKKTGTEWITAGEFHCAFLQDVPDGKVAS